MLISLLFALPSRLVAHMFRLAGIADGMHSWFEAMCPCEEHR